MSRKKHDQEARRLESSNLMYREWSRQAGPPEPGSERDEVFAWAWPLVRRRADAWVGPPNLSYRNRRHDKPPEAGDVWHLLVDHSFRSAPLAAQLSNELCYGKDTSCLDDGPGLTACMEVEVTKRLETLRWDGGGWWNTYAVPAPTRWAACEADQFGLRQRVAGTLLAPLFAVKRGYADVVLWRGSPAGLEMVAIECKRMARDYLKPYQVEWLVGLAQVIGRQRVVVAHWRL